MYIYIYIYTYMYVYKQLCICMSLVPRHPLTDHPLVCLWKCLDPGTLTVGVSNYIIIRLSNDSFDNSMSPSKRLKADLRISTSASKSRNVCVYILLSLSLYIYIYTHIHIYIYIFLSLYIYIYIYIYVYIYIYIYNKYIEPPLKLQLNKQDNNLGA